MTMQGHVTSQSHWIIGLRTS